MKNNFIEFYNFTNIKYISYTLYDEYDWCMIESLLNKTYDIEEVKKWLNEYEGVKIGYLNKGIAIITKNYNNMKYYIPYDDLSIYFLERENNHYSNLILKEMIEHIQKFKISDNLTLCEL